LTAAYHMTLPCRMDEGDWRPEMAWAVPRFSKKKVNWAGRAIALPAPEVNHELDEYQAWMYEYYDALDIVNNWRSSHNFPLNTFHVGLKRRAKAVDQTAITAQRIKRMASIELKLSRFPTMTLSQMQDVGGCCFICCRRGAIVR
jgi:hypothetical protein